MKIAVVKNPGSGLYYAALLRYLKQRAQQVVILDRPGLTHKCDVVILTGSSARACEQQDAYEMNMYYAQNHKGLVLGICFGAQCMWRFLGGRIASRSFRQGREEIQGVGEVEVAFHDTLVWRARHTNRHIQVLKRYRNSLRMFRCGQWVGVLFHPEATPDGHLWLDHLLLGCRCASR